MLGSRNQEIQPTVTPSVADTVNSAAAAWYRIIDPGGRKVQLASGLWDDCEANAVTSVPQIRRFNPCTNVWSFVIV